MKLLLVTLMMLATKAYANGSPFYTDIVGVRYYCAPTPDQPDNGTAYDCIEKAYAGPFSKSESEQLCAGANSTGPADCAITAYAGPFTKSESLNLCTGAYSSGPADCAVTAYAGPFTKSESLDLCGSRSATEATANCAIRAYAGPYTKQEAIRICKSNLTADLTVSMFAEFKAVNSKTNLQKAQELLSTAAEKVMDAKAKALQNLLDLKVKQ